MEIAGSIAFVTGGAGGIGLAIARALVREGARVAIADISRDWLDAAVGELGEAACGIELDVADRAAWSDARAKVEALFGPVDILINNAGIGPDFNPLTEMDPGYFDRMVAIKLTGTFNGVHTFIPGMCERSRGHVVNTASMAGLTASARLGAYTAAKFGVVGLSEVLRAEMESAGIGVSVLCPGFIETRLGETSLRAGVDPVQVGRAKASVGTGLNPAVVGDLVIEGIRRNHSHIVTHAEYATAVRRRMEPIYAAFERVPVRNPRSRAGTDQPDPTKDQQ